MSFKALHDLSSGIKLDRPVIAEWHGALQSCKYYEHTLRVSVLRRGNPHSETFRPYDNNRSTHQFLAFYRPRWEQQSESQILFFFEADVGSELFDEAAKITPGLRRKALDDAIAANDRCALHIANTLATSMASMPERKSYKLVHLPQEAVSRRKLDPMPFRDDGTLDLEYYWLIVFEDSYRNCPHKQQERSLLNVRHA